MPLRVRADCLRRPCPPCVDGTHVLHLCWQAEMKLRCSVQDKLGSFRAVHIWLAAASDMLSRRDGNSGSSRMTDLPLDLL